MTGTDVDGLRGAFLGTGGGGGGGGVAGFLTTTGLGCNSLLDSPKCKTALSYLFWGRQLFNLLVKHCFHALSLLRYDVLRPIEGHTITEN